MSDQTILALGLLALTSWLVHRMVATWAKGD